MKKLIPILDNGHGGMINGVYQTGGKRSPDWKKGILYEGAYNRWLTWLLMRELDYKGIPYFYVSPEPRDVSLEARVARANKIFANHPDTYVLSLHANAGKGDGKEGFTSRGETKSDPIADVFLSGWEQEFQEQQRMRFDYSDGDKDKEAGYYILTNTDCPAVLLEIDFMDHKRGYDRLWSQARQQTEACNLARSVEKLHSGKW